MKKKWKSTKVLFNVFWYSKTFLIMRIAMFILLFSVIQVMAKSSYSQSTRLSLNLKDVSIVQVLDEIENQSEFYFLYNQKLVDVDRKVDVNTRNKKISDILANIFEGEDVNYLVMNRQIVLSPQYITERVDVTRDRQAQELVVTGTVTDENGEPLPGLSIVIKGTSAGTVTNLEGKYSIEVDPSAVLVFSFVGYMTQEVTVREQTVINISLEQDILGLEEVVVIGYGTQRKSDLTGTLTRVNTEKTNDLPNTNILQSLKGSVAGLSIGTPDQAGEEPSFQIRGVNSLSAGNRPLIVVDGIIYWGSLNNLDNNDIKSVDVLKDASAAAVYGSRSANGVIIITTKKGTSEKPVFNFNASYGVSNPVFLSTVLNPEQYLQKILDYRTATGQEANPDNIHDYLTITESNNLAAGKTVDWYDEVVQTSTTQKYNGSVSGRTDKTNYFISGSYFGQEGIVENDNFERITARANFSNKITDWFTVSVKSSFSNLDYSGVAADLSWMLSPYSNYYEGGADSGELEYYPMEDPLYRHPYLNLRIDDHDVRNDLWGLVSSEIYVPFVKGLKWTLNLSLNQNTRNQFRFDDNTLALTENGAASKTITDFFTWTLDNILNYNRIFNNDHSVDATFLVSREYLRTSSTSAQSTNFFSQALGYNSLELGTVPSVSSSYGDQNQTALMGRVNYMYRKTYALTGTVRRDGFSGFAEGNKYATFYSGAFAWTLSNESFMQNISWLDLIKLRVSYGENGNQAIGRYQTLAQMNNLTGTWWLYPTPNYVFGDGAGTSNGVYVTSMANNELGWETTKTFNLGLDFGIFKNVFYGSIDVYSSNTEDVLLQRNIPSMSGFQTIWTNIGKVHNQGVELALNAQPVRNKDFTWDIGCVFDLNRNSIVSLFGVDNDDDGVEDDDIANSWFIDEPLGVFYGYGIDGIHQTDDPDIPTGYEPGDFRIIDHDGDGELTADDRYILGNNLPNYQFSISNTFKYKNLSLYVLINSIQGGGKENYYMGNNIWAHNPNAGFASWSERFTFHTMDYWTPTNPSNTACRINYLPTRAHPYLEDRSFVRIQDVVLSYSFDNKLLNKWHIEGLRVFANGKNLLTFTKWNGQDPENATHLGGYPIMRTFTFGVDLKF